MAKLVAHYYCNEIKYIKKPLKYVTKINTMYHMIGKNSKCMK